MNKRQQLAVGVINELQKFEFATFKKRMRELEGGCADGINFPMGCVKGDALKLLNVMVSFGVVIEGDAGEYQCLIE